MATQQGPSKSPLKTSLPTAYAAVNAEQPTSSSLASREDQNKYLEGRPKATAHHLDIALQHAHQIQAQKDAENMILDRTIELLEIPASPSADPTAPSVEDEETFKSALAPFRPTDYDNLISERNIEGLCGYGLCPRANRKAASGTGQAFRFKFGAKGSGPGGRGRSMDIVPQENLEKWCSDECAERALFIRVQLAEKPVWERRADDAHTIHILLLHEARDASKQPKAEGSASASRGKGVATDEDKVRPGNSQRSRDLALERGDIKLPIRGGRVDVQIKEKERATEAPPTAPQQQPGDATGGSIEGHVPQDRRDKQSADHDDHDDDDADLLDQI
ncbi:hypothetical protein N7492_005192 [Penicillium capsulatum]|uniref:RNA polymerase II subunit B1 CTD phosphatase RPAP2 homolog n=1 Tax=Penicillium capsulatum TaxID=69766 RepID=A0A9W9LQR4_9EURO|nr:hypothetical protein N7492_005192 [Penicillium capsulatum]KAJ6135703.1 hypothetical protein N7512_000863 [Penicillium capsulatum]